MPCEHYKDALVEAAAAGATPQGDLRKHLGECASCRTAFAEEQSLFASIDSSLHSVANSEAPPSLLPRVRVAIEETSLKRGWFSSTFVLATTAAIVLAFFTLPALLRTNHEQEPMNTALKNVAPSAPALSQEAIRSSEPAANPFPATRTATAKSSPGARQAVASPAMPEVLVPKDQEALLVSYADQWYRRKRALLVASEASDSPLQPLQVPPIQIDRLDVKLLAAENAQ